MSGIIAMNEKSTYALDCIAALISMASVRLARDLLHDVA